jgi:hypothetical protein
MINCIQYHQLVMGLESGRNHNDKRLLNLKQFQRQEKSVITSCCLCRENNNNKIQYNTVYAFQINNRVDLCLRMSLRMNQTNPEQRVIWKL